MPTRIAVLASGRGSNLQALHEYLVRTGQARGAQVALVLSDKPDAGALAYARGRGIEAAALDMGTGYSAGLAMMLHDRGIDCVVLAGYLKLVPSEVVQTYRGRLINTHPALLPAFGGQGMYGERVHRAVLTSGARVSGATVHFVDEQYDHGAIIAQWPVPVFDDDTPKTLAARVLRVEHRLLPPVVDAVAAGRITLGADGRARGSGRRGFERAAFVMHSPADEELARELEATIDS